MDTEETKIIVAWELYNKGIPQVKIAEEELKEGYSQITLSIRLQSSNFVTANLYFNQIPITNYTLLISSIKKFGKTLKGELADEALDQENHLLCNYITSCTIV